MQGGTNNFLLAKVVNPAVYSVLEQKKFPNSRFLYLKVSR